MLTLIRNGRLYAPDEMGKCDILIAAGKIIKIAEKINFIWEVDKEVWNTCSAW